MRRCQRLPEVRTPVIRRDRSDGDQILYPRPPLHRGLIRLADAWPASSPDSTDALLVGRLSLIEVTSQTQQPNRDNLPPQLAV
jgi:hypothetical protein